MNSVKQAITLNLKNLVGARSRKIVVFSVDDYGNVRLDSKRARNNMDKAGMRVLSRFDAFDTLENNEDLEILLETLNTVKDQKGNPAVFTAFALPANINFERMASENYEQYHYELLPDTLAKLPGYDRVYALWNEGISSGMLVPQFHGREHFNLKVFEEFLKRRDVETLTALRNRSYTSISKTGYKTISMSAAFDFWDFEENNRFKTIIQEGLDGFEKVFGVRSTHFNAPGGREHQIIHPWLKENGIRFIDTQLVKSEHQGHGAYRKSFNYTGKKNSIGQFLMVRNIVFEPTHDRGVDWVAYTMKQIRAAFRWNRAAIVSSHRVNFAGHIDPKNRATGISALRNLLKQIVTEWPDVEFMSASALAEELDKKPKG